MSDPFTPVPLRARRDGWTPARQAAFIAALAETRCVAAAARAVGMSFQTAYRLRAHAGAASFVAAWDAALAPVITPVSSAAIDGIVTPIFYRGRQVGERRRYDNRAGMFILAIRERDRFGASTRPGDPAQGFFDALATLRADLGLDATPAEPGPRPDVSRGSSPSVTDGAVARSRDNAPPSPPPALLTRPAKQERTMDRRQFIATGTAAAGVALLPGAAVAAATGDAALTAAFDAVFDEQVKASPELATSLGLDKGANAALKHRLDDNGASALAADLARAKRQRARVAAVSPAGLSAQARIDRDVVLYNLDQTITGPERFGVDSPQRPYRITQQGGAYFRLPDFLNSQHAIATADDAQAYLDRLALVGRQLDSDTQVQRAEAPKGRLAPDFSLDLALAQMGKLRGPSPGDNPLTQSLARRTAAAKLPGDWQARAARIVEQQVYPALDRQIALVRELRPRARSAAGVGAMADGAALYGAALAQATTTTLSPAEVHRLGLTQVAELTAQLDTILKGEGMTTGTVGARLATLNAAPAQLYPATDAGRADLIAGLNASVRAMQAKLPQAFTNPPDAPLEIRRVPPEIQDGASNGYYYRAPLDGSRPAIYWINLKSVGDWPRYSLPSLTYHEGVPGHHLQISTAQRAPTHPLRKIAFFNAYLEGWALYAEQLADELGGYATPIERAGYLQSFLFRAARLVVDTGIHTLGWSRDRATQYFVDNVGFARGRSQREVERYCVQPGQACSYKIGHAAWLRARADAQRIAGPRFDLKHFHDILEAGAMPLSMLERLVAERARAA